jgi:16S rRNA processing protein RimM
MSRVGAGSAQTNAAGSHQSGEPAFLAVGKLRHAHGVHGEMLMEILTDFPDRLQPGTILYLESGVGQLSLTKIRKHGQGLLLTFEGYTSPELVSQFRNQTLFVRTDDLPPLAEGEYYHHQLVGLMVVSDVGKTIGKVTEILETGASAVLVVRPESGADILVPMVDAFIGEIDLARRELTVHLIPGMMPGEVDLG